MRKLYSVLAWAIAAGVVVQAAAIGFGYGGMQAYVEGGGVVDDIVVESGPGSYTGDVAFPVHELVGGMVIPALVVLLGVVRSDAVTSALTGIITTALSAAS